MPPTARRGRFSGIVMMSFQTATSLNNIKEDAPYRKNGVVSANPERVAPQKYHHPLLKRSLIARSGSFCMNHIKTVIHHRQQYQAFAIFGKSQIDLYRAYFAPFLSSFGKAIKHFGSFRCFICPLFF